MVLPWVFKAKLVNLGEHTEFSSPQKLLRPDLQICMYLIIPNCLNLMFVKETKFVSLIALTPDLKISKVFPCWSNEAVGSTVLTCSAEELCSHYSASLPSSVHLQQQCQANPIFQLVLSATGKFQRCLFNSWTCRILWIFSLQFYWLMQSREWRQERTWRL